MADIVNPAPGSEKLPETSNVFTELFGNDSAVKNKGMMAPPAPGISGRSVNSGPIGSLKPSVAEHPGRSFFQLSLLVFVITVGVFLTQNSSWFSVIGVNPALKVEQAEAYVDQLNADTRVQKHLAATLLLEQYSGIADEYLYDKAQSISAYNSDNKKKAYKELANGLLPGLTENLGQVIEYLSEEIPNEEVAAVKDSMDELITNLKTKEGQVDAQTLLQDIRDLETAKTLLQSQSFKDELKALDLTALKDAQIESVLNQFGGINSSVTAVISKIKAKRVKWSGYWSELEALTKSVDPLFNTEFSGSVHVSDMKFSTTGTASVSGETSTDDKKNFTLVSNLIDTYESSKWFRNAADRSYVKNDNSEKVTGNFKIIMDIELNP